MPRRLSRWSAAAVVTVVGLGFVTATESLGTRSDRLLIDGPYGALLAGSTDLGPARTATVRLTAALRSAERPAALYAWARDAGLAV